MIVFKPGSTGRRVYPVFLDVNANRNTALVHDSLGADVFYVRDGGAKVQIPLVTMAAPDSAYVSGGFKHAANGAYALCLPNAAIDHGAEHVLVDGSFSNAPMAAPIRIRLDERGATILDVAEGAKAILDLLDIIGGKVAARLLSGGDVAQAVLDKVWVSNVPGVGRVLTSTLTFKRGQAWPNFQFWMLNAVTREPQPGLTVTGKIKVDGSTSAVSGIITDIGDGAYMVDLTAGELNGRSIALLFDGGATAAKTLYLMTAEQP